MSLILLAFDAIVDRKLIRYIILTGLAILIHFPAIIFLPAYWIAKLKTNRTYLIVLAVLLLLTYLYRDRMLYYMVDLYEENEYNMNF